MVCDCCADTNGTYNGELPHKESGGGGWRRDAARRARACCSTKTLLRRLPILQWLPKYTPRNGLADIIAGKRTTLHSSQTETGHPNPSRNETVHPSVTGRSFKT